MGALKTRRLVTRSEPTLGSELLFGWRKALGLNQVKASIKIRVDPGAYCAFETGFRRPGAERAARIEKYTAGAVPHGAWEEPCSKAYRNRRGGVS